MTSGVFLIQPAETGRLRRGVKEKRADANGISPSTLRDRDSNPDLLIQSQLSYH